MIIKQAKSKILYGCDPEAAAVYEKNGKTYALPPFFFRTFLGVPFTDPDGDMRHPVFFKEDGIKLIEDGANFEMTIYPSFDPKELFDRVQECARLTSERILSQFPTYCQPTLQFLPTTDWDVKRWEEMLAKNPEMYELFLMSTQFGCDPDRDVFNLSAQCTIMNVEKHAERYCGGHVHMSGSPIFDEDPDLATKCMCITVGNASVAFSDVPELEHRRLFLYGRPGRMRVQNYGPNNPFGPAYSKGIEYRTPSARWAGNWTVAENVLKWAKIGVNDLLESPLGEELVGELVQPSIQAIMNTDQALARQLLSYIESRI